MKTRAAAVVLLWGAVGGCSETPPAADEIPLGLMLSYTGQLAANSINSERALLLAVEMVNAAGGVNGRPLRVVARNTRSDQATTLEATQELIDAGTPVIMGPDQLDLALMVRPLLEKRTIILPSFNTVAFTFKPAPWMIMGASPGRVACELMARLNADGRTSPIVVSNPTGYNTRLSWELGNNYGMPKFVIPTEDLTSDVLQPLLKSTADAFVLAAIPSAATSLIDTFTALGAVGDPTRWYLSPTLHTPAFEQFIPKGALDGARGVAPGALAGSADFRARFAARWHSAPLDDAYAFFDAGAIAALALARALTWDDALPAGDQLTGHILKVTAKGGTPIAPGDLARGFTLIQQRQEIQYLGVSGASAFDASGQTPTAEASWFAVTPDGFTGTTAADQCL